MTERRFFSLAALLPFVLPVAGGLAFTFTHQTEGASVPLPIRLGLILAFASAYSTVPYVALLAVLWWKRDLVAKIGYRRTVCFAPLVIALLFAPISALITGRGGIAGFGQAAFIAGVFALAIGYVYALIILCSYALVSRLGFLSP